MHAEMSPITSIESSEEFNSDTAQQNLQRIPGGGEDSPHMGTMPRTRTVEGIEYRETMMGILVPASLLREHGGKMRTPKDIVPHLADESVAEQEHVVVITLDGNNQVLKKHSVTKGLVNQSQIHPREIFRCALLDNAVSLVVAHNHPSGNLEPSEADLIATRRLMEVGKTMGIPLLDHLIVAREGFLSIRERYPAYFG